MKSSDVVQITLFVFALIALTPPLGSLMFRVFDGQKTFLTPFLGWLERLTYRVAGVNSNDEMDW